MSRTTLPGNPAQLAHEVTELDATARAMLDAIALLDQISMDSRGQAMDALYERSQQTRADLHVSHGRYDGTAQALRRYQVDLAEAHDQGRAAQARFDSASQDWSRADYLYDQATDELRRAVMRGADEAEIQRIEHDRAVAKRHRIAAEERMEQARAAFEAVLDSIDLAAERAIAAIDAAFSATDDSTWDKIADAAATVVSIIGVLSEWARQVLATVLNAVMEIIKAIVVIIAIVLIAVALIALAIVILYIVAITVAAILTVAAIVIALVVQHILYLALGLAALATVMELLDVPEVWRVRIAALYVAIASPMLGAWMAGNALQDIMGTPPAPQQVTSTQEAAEALGVDSLTKEQRDAYDLLMSDAPVTSPEELAALVAAVDTLGGAGATFVVVKTIPGPPDQHIVLTPSTQDWNFMGDPGAMNDLGGALALGTDLWDSQYERFVVEALQRAGVDKGEPVFFAGFSQGSMVNMEIARDYGDRFDVGGVVNFGSPVNLYPYTGDAPIIEIRNTGNLGPFTYPDPVSLLDFNNGNVNAPNGQTFVGNSGHLMPHAMDGYTKLVEGTNAGAAISEAFAPVMSKPQSTQLFVGVER